MLYQKVIKPIFFAMDPERAHYRTMNLFKALTYIPGASWLIKRICTVEHKALETTFCGLKFKNPVGLAAGFDKDGRYIDELALLGFGFIEVGTVTPEAQVGNDKPRLFRLPKDQALVNRMGFNNQGVDALVQRLQKVKNKDIIIGGNIGKNKKTTNEEATQDYTICFQKLFPYVHYFVINVSSPNTPGLRELQEKEPLTKLIQSLVHLNHQKPNPKPILLKIAPDLTHSQLDDIADIALNSGIDGLIISNTTVDRSNLVTPISKVNQIGVGGLSGKPVQQKSNHVLQYLSKATNTRVPIIGVGGIQKGPDAAQKLSLGALMVQVYSGFIYEGPTMVAQICKHLLSTTHSHKL